MNEQITKLYIQARQLAREVADQNKYDTHAEYQQSLNDKSYDKFAELIAYECMDLALGSSHREDDMGAIIANKIKQHFEV
jgi:hypothetical protein